MLVATFLAGSFNWEEADIISLKYTTSKVIDNLSTEVVETLTEIGQGIVDAGGTAFTITEELGFKLIEAYEKVVASFATDVRVTGLGNVLALSLDKAWDITTLYSGAIKGYSLGPEITLEDTVTLKAVFKTGTTNRPTYLINGETPVLNSYYPVTDTISIQAGGNMNNPGTTGSVFWVPYVINSTGEQGYALMYDVKGGVKVFASCRLSIKAPTATILPPTDDKITNGALEGITGSGTITMPVKPNNGYEGLLGSNNQVITPPMTDSMGNTINGTETITPPDVDTSVPPFATELYEKLVGALGSMFDSLSSSISSALSSVTTALLAPLNTLVETITNPINNALNDLSDKFSKLNFNIPRLDLFLLYCILIVYRMIMFALAFFQFLFDLLSPQLYVGRANVLPDIVQQAVLFFHNLEIPQLGLTVMQLFNTVLTICISSKIFRIIRGRVSMDEGAYDIALAKQEKERLKSENRRKGKSFTNIYSKDDLTQLEGVDD